MDTLIALIDLAGVVAFAATGPLVAGRHTMDVLGGLMLVFVTGIGGGYSFCNRKRIWDR